MLNQITRILSDHAARNMRKIDAQGMSHTDFSVSVSFSFFLMAYTWMICRNKAAGETEKEETDRRRKSQAQLVPPAPTLTMHGMPKHAPHCKHLPADLNLLVYMQVTFWNQNRSRANK